MDEMDDAHFLSYCLWHSQTELHLFSVGHVRRLHALAGVPVPEDQVSFRTFIGMDRWYVEPLVARARQRVATT